MSKIKSPSETYYECDICCQYHPWEWNGDCREDNARLNLEDIPEHAAINSMDDRIRADEDGH